MTNGESRTSPWLIALAVVGGLGVLCCVGGGIVTWFGAKQVAESGDFQEAIRGAVADLAGDSDVVAREFIAVALLEDDSTASWARTSPALQATVTEEGFDDLLRGIRRVMGPFRSATIRSYDKNVRMGTDAGTVHQLVYDGRFEKGAGTIRINLRESGDTLLVEMFRVESPLFLKALAGDDDTPATTEDETGDDPADER